jgi:hypothetical protein
MLTVRLFGGYTPVWQTGRKGGAGLPKKARDFLLSAINMEIIWQMTENEATWRNKWNGFTIRKGLKIRETCRTGCICTM